MRCPTKDPWEGRCKRAATIALPTGREVCSVCAGVWAESHLAEFKRLAHFYEVLNYRGAA